MKKYFNGILLVGGLVLVTGLTACNSSSGGNASKKSSGGSGGGISVGPWIPFPTPLPTTPPETVCALGTQNCGPSGQQPYQEPYSGSSVGGDVKDSDLQSAELAQNQLSARAQSVANQFEMNFESATALVQLSDQIQKLSVQGQMTAADRDAVSNAALGIAGISSAEVNSVIQESMSGNDLAANELMEKAAKNLGMSDASALRDRLLPALGLQLN